MSVAEVTVHTDGALRGNPGPAAAAFVIAHDGVPILEYAEAIGRATNNVAEYTAMVRALMCCQQLGVQTVHLHSDSELMVRQMRGEYRVKHPDIIPLHEEARDLAARFRRVTFNYVPRAQNAEADRLGNEALDGRPMPLPALEGFRLPQVKQDKEEPATDKEAIAILQRAHDAWSAGDRDLKPADVWSAIRAVLDPVEKVRAVKPSRRAKKSPSARK